MVSLFETIIGEIILFVNHLNRHIIKINIRFWNFSARVINFNFFIELTYISISNREIFYFICRSACSIKLSVICFNTIGAFRVCYVTWMGFDLWLFHLEFLLPYLQVFWMTLFSVHGLQMCYWVAGSLVVPLLDLVFLFVHPWGYSVD